MTPEQTAAFWDTHQVTPELWDQLDDRDLLRIVAAQSRLRRPPDGPALDGIAIDGDADEVTIDMPPPRGSAGGFSQVVLDLLVGELTDVATDTGYQIAQIVEAVRLPDGGARITFQFIRP